VIVVDTNVIAYLLLAGQYTAAARATLARDPEWAAPLLWRSEFRNVLALYLRQKHLTLAEAVALQETAETLLEGREFSADSGDVLALASRSRRTAYDCEFVAVAQALGVPLVTSDAQVLGSFPDVATDLQAFGAGKTGD
jgi:predicted nucleic acid-binding protein